MKKRWIFFLCFGAMLVGRLSAQEIDLSTGDSLSFQLEEADRLQAKAHKIQEKLKTSKPFHIKFEMQGMDSILKGLDTLFKHLPIPSEIQLDDNNFRYRTPTLPRFPEFQNPQRTERGGIVKFGGDVVIGRNEFVKGDVVVFCGDVTVYGEVDGGVVTVKGDIDLASTSKIKGDIVCIWGNVETDEGVTAGKTTVLNLNRFFQSFSPRKPAPNWMMFGRFLWILLLLVISTLIVAAFPGQTRMVTKRITENYSKSLLIGMTGMLLIPIIFIVLLITIIGIPVAFLLFPLLIIAGFLMGGTAISLRIGQWIRGRLKMRWDSPAILVCIGILLLESVSLIGKLASVIDPVFGKIFFLLGVLIFFCAWIPGFGAVVMTRFGTRPKVANQASEKRKLK